MPKEPSLTLTEGQVTVTLYIVEGPGDTFVWEIVETQDHSNEILEKMIVSPLNYPTREQADIEGKQAMTRIARGAAA